MSGPIPSPSMNGMMGSSGTWRPFGPMVMAVAIAGSWVGIRVRLSQGRRTLGNSGGHRGRNPSVPHAHDPSGAFPAPKGGRDRAEISPPPRGEMGEAAESRGDTPHNPALQKEPNPREPGRGEEGKPPNPAGAARLSRTSLPLCRLRRHLPRQRERSSAHGAFLLHWDIAPHGPVYLLRRTSRIIEMTVATALRL